MGRPGVTVVRDSLEVGRSHARRGRDRVILSFSGHPKTRARKPILSPVTSFSVQRRDARRPRRPASAGRPPGSPESARASPRTSHDRQIAVESTAERDPPSPRRRRQRAGARATAGGAGAPVLGPPAPRPRVVRWPLPASSGAGARRGQDRDLTFRGYVFVLKGVALRARRDEKLLKTGTKGGGRVDKTSV